MLKALPSRLATIPMEAAFWTAGLLALAFTDPRAKGLLDLCLFKFVGAPWCLGCGLGHSVSFLLHGEPVQSFEAHPFGGLAVLVLVYRVATLLGERFRPPAFLSPKV